MFNTLICLFVSFGLFAQSAVGTLASPIASPGVAIFPIDPTNRGADIVKMISILSSAPYNTYQSQILILTNNQRLGINGLIPYVISSNVKPMKNNTILIVGYSPQGSTVSSTSTNFFFSIVPVEQIVEIIYAPSYKTLAPNATFSATITSGVLPVFPMNLAHRAADIIDVLDHIRGSKEYFRYNQAQSTFSFQTSLNGAYAAGPITNGIIQNVRCVSLSPPTGTPTTAAPCGTGSVATNSTLLFITYNYPNALNANNPYYIIASPDQITGITYNPK